MLLTKAHLLCSNPITRKNVILYDTAILDHISQYIVLVAHREAGDRTNLVEERKHDLLAVSLAIRTLISAINHRAIMHKRTQTSYVYIYTHI